MIREWASRASGDSASFVTPITADRPALISSNRNVSALRPDCESTTVTVSGGPATGTVTFRDGAAVLGTGTLDGSGQASLTTSALTVASHSITAAYEGDNAFGGSVSAPMNYVVTPKTLTITGVTASDKIYAGNASAVLTGGTVSSGVVGGETVTVVPGSGTFSRAL